MPEIKIPIMGHSNHKKTQPNSPLDADKDSLQPAGCADAEVSLPLWGVCCATRTRRFYSRKTPAITCLVLEFAGHSPVSWVCRCVTPLPKGGLKPAHQGEIGLHVTSAQTWTADDSWTTFSVTAVFVAYGFCIFATSPCLVQDLAEVLRVHRGQNVQAYRKPCRNAFGWCVLYSSCCKAAAEHRSRLEARSKWI